MGSFVTKFFFNKEKERSTYQILEEIEDKIRKIEEFSGQYQIKQKRFVRNVLLYGIGSSIIALVIFYFAFLPNSTDEKIYFYSIGVLVFPLIVFILKSLFVWYFQRKVKDSMSKLNVLRAKKLELLDKVKNKETYQKALEILQRFGDNTIADQSFATPTKHLSSSPINSSNKKLKISKSTNMTPVSAKTPLLNIDSSINTFHQQLKTQHNPTNQNRPIVAAVYSAPMKQTPYPIIVQKTIIDKMLDYLISDGPAKRFAMICHKCFKHNGMALPEEYEYAAFRCAFCNYFNPAKKLRPLAPRLRTKISSDQILRQSSESSTDSSDSDSNDKILPKVSEEKSLSSNGQSSILANLSESIFSDANVKLARSEIDKKIE